MAITHICENSRCAHHVPLPASAATSSFAYVTEPLRTIEDTGVRRIERHLYRHRDGSPYFLCEVCHAAAEMTMR